MGIRRILFAVLCAAASVLLLAAAPASAAPARQQSHRDALRGTTTVTTAPGIASTLIRAGVLPLPVPPARFRVNFSGGLAVSYGFPVTGGNPSLSPLAGDIHHAGGIDFVSARGKHLEIGKFDIALGLGKIYATQVNFAASRRRDGERRGYGRARHPGHSGRRVRQRQQDPDGLHFQDRHEPVVAARWQLHDRRAENGGGGIEHADPDRDGGCAPVGANVTVVAGLTASGTPALSAFANDTAAVAPGDGRLVVRHTAAAPAVDVYAGSAKAISGLANGQQQALTVPAGTVQAKVTLAGQAAAVLGPLPVPVTAGMGTVVYAVGSASGHTLTAVTQQYPLGGTPSSAGGRRRPGRRL